MPFVKRVVHPTFLSRKPLDKRIVREESEAVNNNTLVEVLKQLACLTRFAEDIFQDLVLEANNLHCRTDKLKARISKVDATVAALDAKAVAVPVGDLDKFCRIKEHFVAPQHHDHGLFKSQSRPYFVRGLYEGAVVSPVHIIRQIDHHRDDGHRNSKIFMCLPFFRETKVGLDLDIETRRPTSMSTAPTWLHEEDLGVPYDCSDQVDGEKDKALDTIRRLPSPEEVTYAMSLKFQYSDVPIDVTGTGFWRMASFRRSLIQHVEYLTKRKKKKGKRRNSLSGSCDKRGINEALQEAKLKNLRLKSGTQTCRARLGGSNLTKMSMEHKEVQTSCFTDSTKDTWLNNRARFRASICGGNIYEEVDKLRRVRQLEESEDDEGGGSLRMRSRARSDMAVAVKMRDGSARSSAAKSGADDGGQSSSGNWSASSSTRASLESDHPRSPELMLPRTTSQTSLSKDSALSDGNTPVEDIRLTAGLDCRLEMSSGLNSPTKKSMFTNGKVGKDTARWLRSLQEETTDASTTGTITPLLGHRRALSPFDLPSIDDGESSEFSVDNDGYYTSMHTDSGLRLFPIAKAPHETPVLRKARELGGSNSTLSSAGVDTGSARSSYSGPPGTAELRSSFKKKLPPPPPPPRTSTLSAGNSTLNAENSIISIKTKEDHHHSDVDRKTSFSDSDADVGGEKLLGKTAIDVRRIPSMCVVTPSPSDDEAGSTRSDRSSTSPPRTSASTGGSSTDGSTTSDAERNNNISRAYSTLPRNFSAKPQPQVPPIKDLESNTSIERASSFNGQNTNSWPRRPANILYKPETIVLYQNLQENKNDKDRNTSSMRTFFQPDRPQPLSIELAERLSPVDPAPSLRLTPTPNLSGVSSMTSSSGRGARVVLDPLGHVIHCSSGTLARPSSGGSSPTGSVSPTFPAPMNPITLSVPVQRTVPTVSYELPGRGGGGGGFHSIPGPTRYGGYPQPKVAVPTAVPTAVANGNPPRHQYDTNTLPRTRYSTSSKQETSLKENPDEVYQAGTIPRRKTNFSFLRRDPGAPPVKAASQGTVPGPLVSSAKTGAYVRLDGHPNHLVPNVFEAGGDGSSAPGTPTTPSQAPVYSRPQSPWSLTDKPVSRLPSSRTPSGHIPSPTAMLASQALHAAACASRIPSVAPVTPSPSLGRPKSPSQIPTPVIQRYKMGSPPRGPLASSFLQSSSTLPGNTGGNRLPNGIYNQVTRTSVLGPTATTTSMTSVRGNVTNGIAVGPPKTTQPIKITERPKCSEKAGNKDDAKKSMTTEDLFAAIHHSKKKFDIKLEPESSVPSPPSSRSVSPATLTPSKTSTPNKTSSTNAWWGTVPRNGFLTSRGTPEPIAGDRRSWSCDRSTPSPCTTPRATTPTLGSLSPGDRKSWASDRLGPTKQTSLRDFKMLLLQAGRTTPKAESSRPSALEMLKATAPTARKTSNDSSSPSPTTPKTPTTPTSSLSNGYGYNSHHGPNRQGNFTARHGRCRTPLSMIHNTSDILSSTIPEDCSEESDGSSSSASPVMSTTTTPDVNAGIPKPKNLASRFSAVSVLQGLRSSRLPTSTAV